MKKILIAVEGSLYGEMLAKAFRSKGYGVCAVVDRGEDAIKHARDTQPDAILLDFLLEGDIDGIETARMLKDNTHALIVFLNNWAENTWLYRASEINASAIVNKQDLPIGEIVETVRRLPDT